VHVDISMLWRQASTMPVHGPACACAVPMAVSLSPESFELDVRDFIDDKHRLHEIPAWTAMENERDEDRHEAFPAWLDRACRACLDPALHDKVIADVIVVLESRIAHSAGRFSAPSAKATGWLTTPSRDAD
jgi:hypothetical protein